MAMNSKINIKKVFGEFKTVLNNSQPIISTLLQLPMARILCRSQEFLTIYQEYDLN